MQFHFSCKVSVEFNAFLNGEQHRKIFIVDRIKRPKTSAYKCHHQFFLSLRRCLQFTRDHSMLNFHKPSRVFYVTSTYNKTTTDYMKYSSKMAENRVYEIFNSVLKNQLNKHATEQLLEDIFRKLCCFVFPGASSFNSFAKVNFHSALPR